MHLKEVGAHRFSPGLGGAVCQVKNSLPVLWVENRRFMDLGDSRVSLPPINQAAAFICYYGFAFFFVFLGFLVEACI